ncbi:MAG: hypothetical protein QXL91_04495, partial [Candidatus Bathyarchaeia archaeon]
RRYYRWLRKLQELGVLECRVSLDIRGKEHVYTLTPFGKSLCGLIFNGLQPLVNGDGLKFEGAAWYCGIGVINSYDDLVKAVLRLVDEAKSQILLATKYLDLSVSQSLMKAVLRGVELKSVTSAALNLRQFMKLVGSFAGNMRSAIPKMLGLASNMGHYRVGNVSTSFMVVDKKTLVLELPTEEFEAAFISWDVKLIGNFEKNFWKIWKAASELPIGV